MPVEQKEILIFYTPMPFHLGLVCYKIDPFDETILHEIYQNFLVSFISKIAWENIYELRPFIHEHGYTYYSWAFPCSLKLKISYEYYSCKMT